MLFTALVKREIFREAVFLWYTPLEEALLMVEIAAFNAVFAAAASFAAIASSTLRIEVFTADLMDLLRAALFWVTRILFFADLILANPFTSHTFEILHGNPIEWSVEGMALCMTVVPSNRTRTFEWKHTHIVYPQIFYLSIHILLFLRKNNSRGCRCSPFFGQWHLIDNFTCWRKI